MPEKVVSQINFEIEQIEQLFISYADLLNKINPNLVEVTAIASVLHSFYNGIENIFLSVAKGIDENVPKGEQCHKNLLIQMTQHTLKRESVILDETAQALSEYLAFRHFYRHSYSFFLKWEEMEHLVRSIRKIWIQLKEEFKIFTKKLSNR